MRTQTCPEAREGDARLAVGSVNKLAPVEWLASVATLAERLDHALRARERSPADLDRYLAERFQKKGVGSRVTAGTGYAHRVLHRDQEPKVRHLEAICDFLGISMDWLVRGQGPMDREAGGARTYESLPGWAAAAAVELERARVQGYAIRAAGRSPVFVEPEAVTPDFVFRKASDWLAEAPEKTRVAAMEQEAKRIKAAEDEKLRH